MNPPPQPPPPQPPLGLLAELTHRCPLACAWCSNPLALVRRGDELPTDAWRRVFTQAAALGVLQLHLSGGEPMARPDLPQLVAAAATAGLYTNLVTSGALGDFAALAALADAGLEHVQLSLHADEPRLGDALGGLPGGHTRKLAFAAWVTQLGLAFTVNIVVHRSNADLVPALLDLAQDLGAWRVEVAHAHYAGWALHNRAHLSPTAPQVATVDAAVRAFRQRPDAPPVDYVAPDAFARRPKACMDGWGARFLVVAPDGRALPCHAAATLPDLRFDSVLTQPLADIWRASPAFQAYRGDAWLPEPCRACPERARDHGGCRCQAFAVTGDPAATDPACDRSPHHAAFHAAVHAPASAPLAPRRFSSRPRPRPKEVSP